jgi:hypothetical protein
MTLYLLLPPVQNWSALLNPVVVLLSGWSWQEGLSKGKTYGKVYSSPLGLFWKVALVSSVSTVNSSNFRVFSYPPLLFYLSSWQLQKALQGDQML